VFGVLQVQEGMLYLCILTKQLIAEDSVNSFIHSKCYQPSGMLIRWQNSHVPHGWWCTNPRELVK
jgi:hypothetical protein